MSDLTVLPLHTESGHGVYIYDTKTDEVEGWWTSGYSADNRF
jgi:hypothetical protein